MMDFFILAAPPAAFALGYVAAAIFREPDNSDYWEAVASRKTEKAEHWEQQAARNWDRFVNACKEANTIEEELVDCQASNQRLADALAAKTARLERIAEKFEGQQSGTAQLAVRMARGDA